MILAKMALKSKRDQEIKTLGQESLKNTIIRDIFSYNLTFYKFSANLSLSRRVYLEKVKYVNPLFN